MSLSRRSLLVLPLALLAGLHRAASAEPDSAAPGVIQRFYDELLAVMQDAKRLTFDQRYSRLAPTISRTFDLGLMTRIAVGPEWGQIPAGQQERLSSAFSRYTISVYAGRFDDYGGERFTVEPEATANPNGAIVSSKLIKSNGDSESFNYLMRRDAGGSWKVIDVYLSGTISQLAAWRAEFATVLHRDGAEGLVQMIEKRTAALRAG